MVSEDYRMERKRQKTQHNKEDDTSLEKESLVPLEALLSSEVWKQLIFPFVGPGNFRFLGSVSKQFRSLYLEEMDSSSTTTYDQIVTVEQAQLLYQDMQECVLSHAHQPKPYPTGINSDSIRQAQLFHQDVQEGGLQNAIQKERQYLSCKVMARLGRQEVLEYFHSKHFAWDVRTCRAAAEKGNLKLLQWLHERGCPWNERGIFYDAATNGDIPMLQWLYEQGCVGSACTCSLAAENGHLNVLQWLRRMECPWDEETCAAAAKHGHLHVIQWAHSEGCPWDSRTTSNAAEHGHLDILVFALDHDCPTDNLCRGAATFGQLEILQYLHARGGFDLNESVMNSAARGNEFEIVEWLYSMNCPWDASVCSNVARMGNLEMLQWLRARHCPWDHRVYGAGRKHEHILRWARENGCPERDVS